jgi:hypothetical protein
MSDKWPPQTWQDIAEYDPAEMVAGFCSWEKGDPEPGGNHSAAYRWGWTNAAHDRGRDDEFVALRQSYIKAMRIGKAA